MNIYRLCEFCNKAFKLKLDDGNCCAMQTCSNCGRVNHVWIEVKE